MEWGRRGRVLDHMLQIHRKESEWCSEFDHLSLFTKLTARNYLQSYNKPVEEFEDVFSIRIAH